MCECCCCLLTFCFVSSGNSDGSCQCESSSLIWLAIDLRVVVSIKAPHHSLVPGGVMRLFVVCCCQSEYGDIYKVTLNYEGETVTEVKVRYFDTLPPCVSLAVLKTGFLFAASEFGNHALYQFIVSAGRAPLLGITAYCQVAKAFAV